MSKNTENNENLENSKGFDVPDDYFTTFSNSVMNKIEWLDEHKIYPYLTSLKGNHGFTVPENYFEKLEIKNELLAYPNLHAVKKEVIFATPENYFDELSVSFESVGQDQPFEHLNAIEKINPFVTPENYFESNQKQIQDKLLSAKVITLFSSTVRYTAIAALFIICLGVWLFSSYFNFSDKECTSLACIEKSELMKNKNLENIETERLYEVVDTKKLEESLNGENNSAPKSTGDSIDEFDMDDLPEEI
ncbi:MAG: hypothetical protein IPM51_03755 [Sphingobacteriaceae bacterium]|nr:hypothetical protein [Sphingobacteriaceae bacterium]